MASPPGKGQGASVARAEEVASWMTRHGGALRRYFSRRAPLADADDLVQEVFLRLQARAEGERVDNVEGYLFRIARNVLVSRYREESDDGLWRHGLLEDEIDAPDDLSPERILVAKQEYARALVAILNLPPRTRTAFELHRFDKLSYSAIAKRMGVSKGTVQILMQRAIDRLLDDMEEGP